jgi:hypothetical protein
MEREEWCRRFVARLINQAGVTAAQAQHELDGAGFEYLSKYYEDDPKGSADMAMSYWEP